MDEPAWLSCLIDSVFEWIDNVCYSEKVVQKVP
jgi:hypothetical protein